jgi:hypothetical protein
MALPDFIFGRNQDREAADGLRLAGVLITDFTKPEERLTPAEWREIAIFINQLGAAVAIEPTLRQAGYWRDGLLSAEHHSPPFSDEMVLARMVGHLVLTVGIDDAGMACMMGSECAATRKEVDTSIRRGMH